MQMLVTHYIIRWMPETKSEKLKLIFDEGGYKVYIPNALYEKYENISLLYIKATLLFKFKLIK